MKIRNYTIALLLFALIHSSTAWSAVTAYLTLEGVKQGRITGDEAVRVYGFKWSIDIPRDPQSGQPSGQRVHQPITIIKAIDGCSPNLLAALASGERITKFILKLTRMTANGLEEHYYTIVLEDAMIVNLGTTMLNNTEPAFKDYPPMEEVSFTYRKVTVTHEVEGTSADDDWRAPKT